MAMSTTKLVVSTGVVSTGALLGAASWYTKGVSAVEPDASLQKVTETGAFVDTFYYKLPLKKSTPKLSAPILAKSLYCSPSFLPEKILISLTGHSFPKESEYNDSLKVKPGTQISHWTVDTARDGQLLMRFPGGYTYLKANYLADSSELEFWFGSNLSAEVSASPIVQAVIPFHTWYSRILCKNVAVTMAEYLKTE
mmetsp:Transcript_43801/g.105673  ORF Transcript_43801/g.105673 Transcript_43801/m.105673 type:complete len:196 (-) Transcript_43801:767-1354(-)